MPRSSKLPQPLAKKLEERREQHALRTLSSHRLSVDFSSNDYLGFAKSRMIFDAAHALLTERGIFENGATGSRLISGNHDLYSETESLIAKFHKSESALVFNSGYDANVGFFSSVPQRNDFILYDELCHASIRDGIGLSRAKSFKFAHNDFEDLERLIVRCGASAALGTQIYIATESVFSMDGDSPNLSELVRISEKYDCLPVIDEAHALGVFGEKGEGLVQQLHLEDKFFARIMTFGKGLGCHGAAILSSTALRDYLINFARSFIYTTGLPPHSLATIACAYEQLQTTDALGKLIGNIAFFNSKKAQLSLKPVFVYGKSAIQSAIIPGNENVKKIAMQLQQQGFDMKAILSPTVPQGQERLRICLHSYNTTAEIQSLLEQLHHYLFNGSAI